MKKILSILMVLVMLISGTVFASAKDNKLKFGMDGKFEILVMADIQSGYPVGDALKAYINEALDATNPDLVILLGDNIMSTDTDENYWKGYDEVLPIFENHSVPFTFVFGNHDDESAPTVTKEEMLSKYQSYRGCLAYDADESLHGCATHNLPIYSNDGSKLEYNLWLMDSGDYAYGADGHRFYDCVRKDQIDWYNKVSAELEREAGAKVPSLMFQHIVPQEVAQAVMPSLPFGLGAITYNFTDGSAYSYFPPMFLNFTGVVGEHPCPSEDNEGQWDAIVERGDVKAMFVGHDHTNTYKVNVNGVDCINVPGTTFKSYHSYTEQGATLITLDENDLSTYSTKTIYTNDLAVKDGSKIPGCEGARTVAGYRFSIFVRGLVEVLLKIARAPYNMIAGLIK
ncbi:MAG: metallophosphoesterase [Ruminococcus sp.]|nr:metallophosphoesterase [Candidatus Copronaster equi]